MRVLWKWQRSGIPGSASRTRPTSSVTCDGTPTPIVSASAISNGAAFRHASGDLDDARHRHLALERAAERGRDRDLRADAGGLRGRAAISSQAAIDSSVVTPWLRWLNVSLATTAMPISLQPAAAARSKPLRLSTRPM